MRQAMPFLLVVRFFTVLLWLCCCCGGRRLLLGKPEAAAGVQAGDSTAQAQHSRNGLLISEC
jgi:hypothetical protein